MAALRSRPFLFVLLVTSDGVISEIGEGTPRGAY